VSQSKPSDFLVQRLRQVLQGRELEVILLRLGVGESKPYTLQEIGDKFNLTRERVRQIQHRALIEFADPELNAMLLVGDLSTPDSRSLFPRRLKRTRNTNSEIVAKTQMKNAQIEDQDSIIIRFTEPVNGFDPESGDLFLSDRHKVIATWARVDNKITEFLNDDSQIIGSWETSVIKTIQWPTGRIVPATRLSYTERMEEIKSKYPNAYSKWSYEEDQLLIREFNAGIKISEMCKKHGRARGGIVSRLRKLGVIAEDQSSSGL
jgi:hypothetical protein